MVIALRELHKHVDGVMRDKIPKDMSLFGYSTDNHIGTHAEGYLQDTPHGLFERPGTLPTGHSDHLPMAIRNAIGKAEHTVDIVNMMTPNGAFRTAILAALTVLAGKKKKISVRILFGKVFGRLTFGDPDTPALLRELADRIRHIPERKLEVWAGATCWEAASWNHAKLVAVDGKTIFTGGHNMWADVYLGKDEAVFDLTLRYDGSIAKGGHDFANGLWNFVRQRPGTTATYYDHLRADLTLDKTSPPNHAVTGQPAGDLPAMWVTSPGWGVFQKDGKHILESTMWIAFFRALETSSHCRIAQQTFCARPDTFSSFGHYSHGRIKDYPNEFIVGLDPHANRYVYDLQLIDDLGKFLMRDPKNELEIVVSPSDAHGYGRGEPLGQLFDLIAYRARLQHGGNKDFWVERLNKQVTLVHPAFRSNGEVFQRWAVTRNLMVNHAKFWMLDHKLFYVGSENFYPSTGFAWPGTPFRFDAYLQEFGIVAEANPTIAKMMVDEYFKPLWEAGVPYTVIKKDLMWDE